MLGVAVVVLVLVLLFFAVAGGLLNSLFIVFFAIFEDLRTGLNRRKAVPIVPGVNAKRGLCPRCGAGSLAYQYSKADGDADQRYKRNPLCCFECVWTGHYFDAQIAKQNVVDQIKAHADQKLEMSAPRVLSNNISISTDLTPRNARARKTTEAEHTVPIVDGADSSRGLCPLCGAGSLRYTYSRVDGGPDMRYGENPLWCLDCHWKGSITQAWTARENVMNQIAYKNTQSKNDTI